SFVRTSRARHKIQHWIRARQRQRAAELGRRLLEREARRHKRNLSAVSETDWERTTREFGCQQVDELCARVGFGKYAAQLILRRLLPSESLPEERPAGHALARLRRTVEQVFRLREKSMTLHDGDLMMYRARCCSPIRGEPIVGYITRGRGISVHARHCPNVENLLYDVERRVEVEWSEGGDETYAVRLAIRISDRRALLNNVTGIIAQHDCNIASVEAHAASADGTGLIEMVFGVRESRQLDRILKALRKVAGVREVTRVWRV
ncbi:MAG: ACT domain-containing protein, partial [Terriglobia bacterium]